MHARHNAANYLVQQWPRIKMFQRMRAVVEKAKEKHAWALNGVTAAANTPTVAQPRITVERDVKLALVIARTILPCHRPSLPA